MTIKKNIATSEEGFLFNPGTGDSFSTNTIGGDIIALLKEDKKIDQTDSTRYKQNKQIKRVTNKIDR